MTPDLIGAALLTAGTLLAIRALSRAPRQASRHAQLARLVLVPANDTQPRAS